MIRTQIVHMAGPVKNLGRRQASGSGPRLGHCRRALAWYINGFSMPWQDMEGFQPDEAHTDGSLPNRGVSGH